MSIDNQSRDRSGNAWSALLWLLPVLLLLGLVRLGASPDEEVRRADPPAVVVSTSTLRPLPIIDHSSVNWALYPSEPAQPEQSVAAYDRD